MIYNAAHERAQPVISGVARESSAGSGDNWLAGHHSTPYWVSNSRFRCLGETKASGGGEMLTPVLNRDWENYYIREEVL